MMAVMTRELALFLALIAVAASWLFLHVLLLASVLRMHALSSRLRLLAWLPPATPIVAWLAGARGRSLLWAGHALVYAWLRSLA